MEMTVSLFKLERLDEMLQNAQVSLKSVLLTSAIHILVAGAGFGQTKEGRTLSEDAARKGASDTSQAVAIQIVVKPKMSWRTVAHRIRPRRPG